MPAPWRRCESRAFCGAGRDARVAGDRPRPSARELGVDPDRLNVHGGAIAVGDPFGMTGARVTSTLMNGLRETGGRYGLETMCVGGGQGMALVLERV